MEKDSKWILIKINLIYFKCLVFSVFGDQPSLERVRRPGTHSGIRKASVHPKRLAVSIVYRSDYRFIAKHCRSAGTLPEGSAMWCLCMWFF